MSEQDYTTRGELVLGRQTLPDVRDLTKALREWLNANVQTHRERRGAVTSPEDTYDLVRGLGGGVVFPLQDYRRAFQTIEREAHQVLEEELIEAVGEQDGVPNANLTVPDLDGTDLVISRDTRNEYDIDADAVMSAVAFEVLEATELRQELVKILDKGGDSGDRYTELETFLAGAMILAMQRLTETGAYKPQVSKVKALAESVARIPAANQVSATVRAAIRKRVKYLGVKLERKYPKAKA